MRMEGKEETIFVAGFFCSLNFGVFNAIKCSDITTVSGTYKTNKTRATSFKYPQNKPQFQEIHVFPVRHVCQCY